MKTLSIDHGTKRIGVAISDELGITARVLPIIKYKNTRQAIDSIKSIITKEKCDQILIGLPSGYNNVDSEQTHIVKEFAQSLSESTSLPIIFWDETYTSKNAIQSLIGKTKKNLDSEVAKVILIEFLNSSEH